VSVLRALAAAALLGLGSYYLYKLAELPQSQVLGPTITHGSTARHAVALTYDDGPNPPDTDGILTILRAHHAHATFFVNGIAAQTAPKTLKRMHAEGNEIENHGWDHGHLEALLTAAQIDAQLARTDDAIAGATGSHTHYLRPPFGLRDRAVIDEATKRGYATVMWTGHLAGDWDPIAPATIAERVLANARDGAILVMHDGDRGRGGDRRNVVAATERVVRELQARGYRLETLADLLHA
jgi:peptidoglycan/xylan/chitin deacetylase (PgdA/CDA1 family)